jgi:hypothetical protein
VMVMSPPRRGRVRRVAARVGGVAKRAGHRAGKVAASHAVPAMGMALGGAIAGALDAKGIFNKLPAFGGSRALTLAAAGYVATRFSKNNTIRMAGLAAIAVGAFDAVKSHMIAGGMGPAVPSGPPAAKPATHGTEGHDDHTGEPGDGGPY